MRRLAAPTRALPLDAFRALVGLLALGYCVRQLVDVPLYWAPDGVMAHSTSRELYGFTWQPLFHPTMSAPGFFAIFGLGCALSVAIVIGLMPRASALLLYLIVVCGYRFNFLLLFIDDVVVHLLLFWVALLPVGTTLTLASLCRDGPGIWARWRERQVPGATLRLFLGNLVLLYAVAGTTKWGSPLWLSGDALYATLKLPCSWFADEVGPGHLPLLRILDYAALVLEPLFALGLCLPARGALRWALAAGLLAFHLGITVTLDVPFANLGCLTALPLIFRGGSSREKPERTLDSPGRFELRASERFALFVFTLLVGAMICSALQGQWRQPRLAGSAGAVSEVPGSTRETGGPVQTALYAALWTLGLAQQYRLLDWIDERNFHVKTTFHVWPLDGTPRRATPVDSILPRGMRSGLLLSYLGGVTWMPVPPGGQAPLRKALGARIGQRFCRAAMADEDVLLEADYERVDPRRPTPREHIPLAAFRCTRAGEALPLSPGMIPSSHAVP